MARDKESLANGRKAGSYFGLDGSEPYTGALHHKDESLRYSDPERYNEGRPEDLEVLPFKEHCSLHAKKQKPSEEKKRKTSQTLKGIKRSPETIEKIKVSMRGNQNAKKKRVD